MYYRGSTTDMSKLEESQTNKDDIILASNIVNKGGWRIDYIRVENQERKNPRKRKLSKSDIKSSEKRKKNNRIKSIKRKEIRVQNRPKSVIISNNKFAENLQDVSTNKIFPMPVNFDKICTTRPDLNSLLTKELISVPEQPKNIATSLPTNAPPNNCPGCSDAFLSPAIFFQHLYRKSVDINFDCKQCKQLLSFTNKCLLRIHVLAHLEFDKDTTLPVEDVYIRPLESGDETCAVLNHQTLLKCHRKTASEINFQADKCMECLDTFSDNDAVRLHMLGLGSAAKTLLDDELSCDVCKRPFATTCALSAHKRLHSKKVPYICPGK